jgi:hypothetical protein
MKNLKLKWIKTGIICGFLTAIVFPAMIFADLPVQLTLTLGATFGILLLIASIGLYHFISIHKDTVALQLATLFNIIAGSVVVLMITVQLGLFSEGKNYGQDVQKEVKTYVFKTVNLTQLSLDVAWDIFISLGTILFSLSMLRHQRLGKILGSIGIILGAGLLVLNIYTFPVPPGDAGLIDLGPFTAQWYLAVTIMLLLSVPWAKEALQKTE